MEPAAIIQRCRLFARVEPAARSALVAIARPVSLAKGHTVFRQDDPCPGIYVVGTGLARIFKIAPSGKDHTLHLAGPGQTFAEVACLGCFPCPAWAEVIEDTAAVLLPDAQVQELLAADHRLCRDLLVGMGAWVHHLTGLLEDIVLRDAAGRLARHLLERSAGVDGRVVLPSALRHLASHLNLTPETLSRTLRRLIDAGLLARDAEGFTVTDPLALRAVADGVGPEY
ncbi:MAG: Crp/Fnr family transcriptional regulator [Planctomycetes bacterium]|nr:Crp/Fnr family transcriptional regulator [Planctomycetota bacterium]